MILNYSLCLVLGVIGEGMNMGRWPRSPNLNTWTFLNCAACYRTA